MSSIIHSKLPKKLQTSVTFSFLKKLQCIDKQNEELPSYQQAYGKDYIINNQKLISQPIPHDFFDIIKYYSNLYECDFNMMLINWYPNGSYYIRPHSDNEKQIKHNSPIVSISYGETRIFVTENVHTNEKKSYLLENYDTIAMLGSFQSEYKHSILKQPEITKERINISLRCLIN
jgi:alkylated DNA repair dioxygenase AlkB